jgi:hypothetical protein
MLTTEFDCSVPLAWGDRYFPFREVIPALADGFSASCNVLPLPILHDCVAA